MTVNLIDLAARKHVHAAEVRRGGALLHEHFDTLRAIPHQQNGRGKAHDCLAGGCERTLTLTHKKSLQKNVT